MIDVIILIAALSAVVIALIYASILAWLFIQEFKDE